jgi:catechol 2,3-dioxygenase-like lactoylglutathione lyase family enzyme
MSSRVQLALNVNDVGEAVAFYSRLFGAEPAKLRPGYANFAITEPPLKLVLLENPGQGGTLNHLGIEVADIATVDAEQARLAEAGLASADERATTCCYAKQDKFWMQGPSDGERWEIYTVLADSQTFYGEDQDGPGCCGEDDQQQASTPPPSPPPMLPAPAAAGQAGPAQVTNGPDQRP